MAVDILDAHHKETGDLPGEWPGLFELHPLHELSLTGEPMSQGMSQWLAGVRILDLSQYIPGPLASLLLADMGADVLKIEPPSGDPMQTLGPRNHAGEGLFHQTLNAGKRILRIDLKHSQGREALLALAREADVLIEGFRPGVMERLGLGIALLRAHAPRLIVCSISGYGAAGESLQKAGHDANYLAEAGVLDRNGHGDPVFFDPPVADVSGSLFAAIAILGALQGRHRTGQGCAIDLGLADVIMPLQMLQVADFGENRAVPERRTTYLNGGAAYYQVYRTRDDRYVVVGAVEPKFWRRFSETAGHPEWVARQVEPLPQHRLIADVADVMAALSFDECLARFSDDECCVSPVLALDEAMVSPRLASRRLVVRAPDGSLQALFPAWVDGAPPAIRPAVKQGTAD
jgi:crotonobetainyl-CoA:carnitine CoA-transferase CaiB-like acyl-CoA transferase